MTTPHRQLGSSHGEDHLDPAGRNHRKHGLRQLFVSAEPRDYHLSQVLGEQPRTVHPLLTPELLRPARTNAHRG